MPRMPFRIDGWLPARGATVWFGAGSTGKTQLLLWMAATIASRPERREPTWLGGSINGTGHVLILSAEDTSQQIIDRLRNIVRTTMGQDAATARETCARLHVMPFLSMSEDEFRHPNASLFRFAEDRVWRASGVMEEVREYIEVWNARHSDPADRIVGVVMDSATSMAGFDSMDEGATTNFFFYLGRLCETLRIFCTIIGHVPKAASVPQKNPWGTAASRLRGVAIWTTAPRMVVEVRFIQEWHTQKGGTVKENKDLRAMLPGVKREDILVVYVAKANLEGVCREPRYLVRTEQGAFEGVEAPEPHDEPAEPAGAGAPGTRKPRVVASTSRDSLSPAEQENADRAKYGPGTPLVVRAMKVAYPDIAAGELVIAEKIVAMLDEMHLKEPLEERSLVGTASGGGKIKARPGSITWHLQRLVAAGVIIKTKRRYRFVSWPDPSQDLA